ADPRPSPPSSISSSRRCIGWSPIGYFPESTGSEKCRPGPPTQEELAPESCTTRSPIDGLEASLFHLLVLFLCLFPRCLGPREGRKRPRWGARVGRWELAL